MKISLLNDRQIDRQTGCRWSLAIQSVIISLTAIISQIHFLHMTHSLYLQNMQMRKKKWKKETTKITSKVTKKKKKKNLKQRKGEKSHYVGVGCMNECLSACLSVCLCLSFCFKSRCYIDDFYNEKSQMFKPHYI